MSIIPQRPAPVRDRLLRILLQHHRDFGMTTAEIAVAMGRSTQSVSATLCRLRIYGFVAKIPGQADGARPIELTRWRLP